MKKIIALVLSVALIMCIFAGCSSKNSEKYSDTTLIIGYTEETAPFLKVDKNGKATGFSADLWKKIFDGVKGDLKDYRFEKVEKGYALEDEGGFFDSEKKEYSAGLLMGAVKKNDGTFNEDYSFTEAIISNRVIAVTKKGSKVKSFSDFAGAKAVVLNPVAKESFSKNTQLSSACAGVTEVKDLNAAFTALDSGSAAVLSPHLPAGAGVSTHPSRHSELRPLQTRQIHLEHLNRNVLQCHPFTRKFCQH